MPTLVTHPQATLAASHPVRLKCVAVHGKDDRRHELDVLVPLAIAANLAAIGRLVSGVLKESWIVTSATATDDCF